MREGRALSIAREAISINGLTLEKLAAQITNAKSVQPLSKASQRQQHSIAHLETNISGQNYKRNGESNPLSSLGRFQLF
jgi:hypothetical protein